MVQRSPRVPVSSPPTLQVGEFVNVLNISSLVIRPSELRLPLKPDNNLQDGYAVISEDGPGDYPIIGEARAGDAASEVVVKKGTVAYITTGGPMPDGADAVIQVENTLPLPDGPDGEKRVRIVKPAKGPGDDVRAVVSRGEMLLSRSSFFCICSCAVVDGMGLSKSLGVTAEEVRKEVGPAMLDLGCWNKKFSADRTSHSLGSAGF